MLERPEEDIKHKTGFTETKDVIAFAAQPVDGLI